MSIISIIACTVGNFNCRFGRLCRLGTPLAQAVQPTRMEQPRTMEQTSQPTPLAQAVQPTRVKQPMTVEQTSQPTTVAQAVQPTTMVQAGQPTTMNMNPMGSRLIQMPNGQLFMLPSNSYSVAQPVVLQALQVVQPVSTNNA